MPRRTRVADRLQTLTIQVAVGKDYRLSSRNAARDPSGCSHTAVISRAVGARLVWQVNILALTSNQKMSRMSRYVVVLCKVSSLPISVYPCHGGRWNWLAEEVVASLIQASRCLPRASDQAEQTSTSHSTTISPHAHIHSLYSPQQVA